MGKAGQSMTIPPPTPQTKPTHRLIHRIAIGDADDAHNGAPASGSTGRH